MTRKSIRFWHYGNEPVLIKMRAGQTLHHCSGGPTDEGWQRDSDVWHFDGNVLTHEWCNDGADCDGRLTQYGESFCFASDVMAGNYVDGIIFPRWQKDDCSQRDYSAEAMGY